MPRDTELRRITDEIARALGEGWAHDAKHDFEQIRFANHTDGHGISVQWVRNAAHRRLAIGGRYPELPHGEVVRGRRPHIEVAWGRGPAAIAGDIRRRLLPAYLPDYERHVERRRMLVAEEEARNELAAQLARELPGGRVVTGRTDVTVYGNDGARLRMFGAAAGVEMELHVPAALAALIVATIRDFTIDDKCAPSGAWSTRPVVLEAAVGVLTS
jgi:hypothetical protein